MAVQATGSRGAALLRERGGTGAGARWALEARLRLGLPPRTRPDVVEVDLRCPLLDRPPDRRFPPPDGPGPAASVLAADDDGQRPSAPVEGLALPLEPGSVTDRPDRYIWQVQVHVRCHLVRARWQGVARSAGPAATAVVDRLLAEAEAACALPRGWWRHRHGGPVEAAWSALHAAEVLLVAAGGPPLRPPVPGSSPEEASVAALRLQREHQDSALRHLCVRSFRNAVLVAAAGALLVVVALVALGALVPAALPVCGTGGQSCLLGATPARGDVGVAAVVGGAAGALSGVLALRDLEGSTTPFAVPKALALLKVPVGALAAVLGLLLVLEVAPDGMRPTTATGVLAWAVVLGASQQLVTGLADARGRALLAKV